MSYPPQPPQQPQQNQQGWQGQAPQYPQNQFSQAPQFQAQGYQQGIEPQRNQMALIGFILALVAIPMTFIVGWLGWLLNLGAFVVSLVANSQIKKANGAMGGKGLAVAGIVISSVWFGLMVILFLAAMALGAALLGGFM